MATCLGYDEVEDAKAAASDEMPVLIPCEFCAEVFPVDVLLEHQPYCADEQTKEFNSYSKMPDFSNVPILPLTPALHEMFSNNSDLNRRGQVSNAPTLTPAKRERFNDKSDLEGRGQVSDAPNLDFHTFTFIPASKEMYELFGEDPVEINCSVADPNAPSSSMDPLSGFHTPRTIDSFLENLNKEVAKRRAAIREGARPYSRPKEKTRYPQMSEQIESSIPCIVEKPEHVFVPPRTRFDTEETHKIRRRQRPRACFLIPEENLTAEKENPQVTSLISNFSTGLNISDAGITNLQMRFARNMNLNSQTSLNQNPQTDLVAMDQETNRNPQTNLINQNPQTNLINQNLQSDFANQNPQTDLGDMDQEM